MTSDAPRGAALACLLLLGAAAPARAADPAYPFEGTWVRANRVCTANAPRVRTYTSHEVTSASGRCTFRKVAAGGGQFELFEDCRRAERSGNYTEIIHMLGSDLMQVRRQLGRLKIARPLRYARCTVAAPAGAPRPAPPPHHPAPAEARPSDPKPTEASPPEPKP